MGRVVALSIAVGALLAASLVAPPAGDAGRTCAAAGSRTIVASDSARVFRLRGRVYGCLHRRNVRVPLEDRFGGESLSETRLTSLKPRLAGRFVGYAYEWDNGSVGGPGVEVADLARGTRRGVELDPSTEEDHLDAVVRDIVVTTRGSLAWTWFGDFLDPARGEVREVRKLEPTDRSALGRLLDSGPEIGLRSLARRGSNVSWVNRGQRVSAPLR